MSSLKLFWYTARCIPGIILNISLLFLVPIMANSVEPMWAKLTTIFATIIFGVVAVVFLGLWAINGLNRTN